MKCSKCGNENIDIYDYDEWDYTFVEFYICCDCDCQFDVYYKRSLFEIKIRGESNE